MNQNTYVLPDEAARHKLLQSPLTGDGLMLLFEAGLIWLTTNQAYVNSLNVFPVPDGDTGTNMVLTMQAAFSEADQKRTSNVGETARAFAQGALMGARGNSGVILSQIWRGFSRALDHYETMDSGLLIRAMQEARNTAYKGVVKPVEGTILTVIKDMTYAAEKSIDTNVTLSEMLLTIVQAGDESVKRTPELLPILKQAGVVDSGGTGLFYIFEGMLRLIQGQGLDASGATLKPLAELDLANAMETVEEGQDYEVVIDFAPHQHFSLDSYYEELTKIGTSIQVGEGDGIYRMHIHTELAKRYEPISYTESQGIVKKIMMENLQDQVGERNEQKSELTLTPVNPGEVAVVAVSPGRGLSTIFASLGAAAIIEGGQTMNPSVQELVAAFENLPTNKIIILPNNKNIILAAQNAAKVSVKEIGIIKSRNAPQGFAAMLRLNPEGTLEENVESMKEAIQEVHTGEITIATRSVEIDGVVVGKGEVIALYDGKLISSAKTIEEAIQKLVEKSDLDEVERITFFYGEGLNQTQANHLADGVREKHPEIEIEIHDGGQPHYQLILAFE
ncbi:MAG TPA: DAK2 domain-containing protein [Chloroflexi bacterium]|jgi:DAK2 domain fusion protein YloV|nr:DAK2 domain-containing protein [Chloroflexota bacterium]